MSVSGGIVSRRRLALGIEVMDMLRQRALSSPVRMELESGIPHTSTLAGSRRFSHTQQANRRPDGLVRHPSGRYSLHYYTGVADRVDVRIYDLGRHYVPRRLRVPIVSLDDVLDREADEIGDYLAGRARFPMLFPGAAYALSRVTGLRGRVVRDGVPERWAVLEARLPTDATTVVARARADDRGEFVLVVPPQAVPASDLSPTLDLAVSVWAPATPAVPTHPGVPTADPYWDAPLEEIVNPIATDAVSAGTQVPATFVASATVSNVTLRLDRLLTSREVGDLIFTPP